MIIVVGWRNEWRFALAACVCAAEVRRKGRSLSRCHQPMRPPAGLEVDIDSKCDASKVKANDRDLRGKPRTSLTSMQLN